MNSAFSGIPGFGGYRITKMNEGSIVITAYITIDTSEYQKMGNWSMNQISQYMFQKAKAIGEADYGWTSTTKLGMGKL